VGPTGDGDDTDPMRVELGRCGGLRVTVKHVSGADLDQYRSMRDFGTTVEPRGELAVPVEASDRPRFVVQEHHARRLHWDFRLERDGVLVSWAVPRGMPTDPGRNHLAVHVEDHPLEYGSFEGRIPDGSYGAGEVRIWDRGDYETHKWRLEGRKPEVMVTLHGDRIDGRYVLFQTGGKNWMIHRMDPPQDPLRVPLPKVIDPMLAQLAATLPPDQARWAYEFKWDGLRAIVFCEGGTIRIQSRRGEDVTARYPELRALARALGSTAVVLDGEIVAIDPSGVPRFELVQQRMGLASPAAVERVRRQIPVFLMIFDILYTVGRDLRRLPYLERRSRLVELALEGPNWHTPEHVVADGHTMLEAGRVAGMEGIMAKLIDSPYEEGLRSGSWLKIKYRLRQELVVGGWTEGEGGRSGVPGALLMGYWDGHHLVYAGKVGAGLTEAALADLSRRLQPLERSATPFAGGGVPRSAHHVEPILVAEVEFAEWTRAGRLRAPTFKGLRLDKPPRSVVREVPRS